MYTLLCTVAVWTCVPAEKRYSRWGKPEWLVNEFCFSKPSSSKSLFFILMLCLKVHIPQVQNLLWMSESAFRAPILIQFLIFNIGRYRVLIWFFSLQRSTLLKRKEAAHFFVLLKSKKSLLIPFNLVQLVLMLKSFNLFYMLSCIGAPWNHVHAIQHTKIRGCPECNSHKMVRDHRLNTRGVTK